MYLKHFMYCVLRAYEDSLWKDEKGKRSFHASGKSRASVKYKFYNCSGYIELHLPRLIEESKSFILGYLIIYRVITYLYVNTNELIQVSLVWE